MISSLIESCVNCKKLRGATLTQHMANLPPDRTETSPPFTNVGFDVFGPWEISMRRLRGDAANAKRRGLIFTCLSSRAIHIEVLETMDANSFICALRRFFAIRGPVTKLRCDRGTNFVGGKSLLEQALSEMDQTRVQKFVAEQGCEWIYLTLHMHRILEAYGSDTDWHYTTRFGRNVTGDWTRRANPWTTSDSHGRGDWNRQQPPYFSSTL